MATNILNLAGLTTEQVTVIDRNGREWPVHDGLPLRTALALMELAPAWESGALDAQQIRATVRGVMTVFKRLDASVTEDDLYDAFDVDDLIQIILFLSSRVEARSAPALAPALEETAETAAEESTPTTTPTDLATARTKRRKESSAT